MSLFDGRMRANVQKLQRGCPEHPAYRGKGEQPPCFTCYHLALARNELTQEVAALIKDVLIE